MQITSRDVHILKILSDGAATFKTIQSSLAAIRRKEPGIVNKYSLQMSISALKHRLSELKRETYINSGRYQKIKERGVFSLYVVGDAGKNMLIRDHGFTDRQIRQVLPDRWKFVHELEHVAFRRTVREESTRLNYQYDIEDEEYLRGLWAGKRGVPYPDTHLELKFRLPQLIKTVHLAVEIDNNTEPDWDLVEKIYQHIAHTKWNVFFLFTDGERKERVKNKFNIDLGKKISNAQTLDDQQAWKRYLSKVIFATLNDFCTNGFLHCKQEAATGQPCLIFPREFSSR